LAHDRPSYLGISYTLEGIDHKAQVGLDCDVNGEAVFAILEGDVVYLVCTTTRGVLQEMPILIGKDDTTNVEEFE
jgi:hypothetical protein